MASGCPQRLIEYAAFRRSNRGGPLLRVEDLTLDEAMHVAARAAEATAGMDRRRACRVTSDVLHAHGIICHHPAEMRSWRVACDAWRPTDGGGRSLIGLHGTFFLCEACGCLVLEGDRVEEAEAVGDDDDPGGQGALA